MSHRIVTPLAATLLLVGCSVAELPEDNTFVEEEWAKGIQRLGAGLVSVYPPSEDYQVGDVYGYGWPQSEGCDRAPDPERRSNWKAIRLGTADVRDQLIAASSKRFQFPDSARLQLNAVTAVVEGPPAKAVAPSRQDLHPARLSPVPIVAFPEFTLAAGKVAKFGGSFAGDLFAAVFGGASRSTASLLVRVPQAETYGMTVYQAKAALQRFCATPVEGAKRPCDEKTIAEAIRIGTGTPVCDEISVMLVSRVYQTRHLEYKYTFDSEQAFAAALAASRAGTAEAAKARMDALATVAKLVAIRQGTFVTDSVGANQAMDELFAGLAADLEALSKSGGTGGFISFGSFDASSVTLSQDFKRPLVFAYGGVNYSAGEIRVAPATATRPRIAPAPVSGDGAVPPPLPVIRPFRVQAPAPAL